MTTPTVVAILHEETAQTAETGECLRRVLGDTPWRLVCAAQLAAVVADFTTEQLAPSRTNLSSWLSLLSQLGLGRAIVPMRFGQAAEDLREIERFLTCRQEHLRGVLAFVGHRIELVVRLVSPVGNKVAPGENAPASSAEVEVKTVSAGRLFLLNRKRDFFAAGGGDDAQTAEQIVRLALGERALAIAHEPPTAPIHRGGVCVLMNCGFATEAIGLIRAAAEKSSLSVLVTGPLPPLGFAAGAGAGAGTGARAGAGNETFRQGATLTRPGEVPCER